MPTEQATRRGSETAEAVVPEARSCIAGTRPRPSCPRCCSATWSPSTHFVHSQPTARVQDAIEIADAGGCRSLGAPRSGSRSGCSARPIGRDRASHHERGATPTRGASRGTEPTDRRHRRSPAHRRGPRAKCGIGSGRAVARVARGSGRGDGDDPSHSESALVGGHVARGSRASPLRVEVESAFRRQPRGVHARGQGRRLRRRHDRRMARPPR